MASNLESSTIPYAPPAGQALPYTRGGERPRPGTLTELFFNACERFKKPDSLQVKVDGKYTPISHATLLQRVRHAALGLQELGIERGDRVGILSENRPEWAIADYACLTAGLIDVPVYPTLPAEQIPHILDDSGAVALFVSTADQVAKISSIRAQVPAIKHVISFVSPAPAGANMALTDLEKRGAAVDSAERQSRYRSEALEVKPDDPATIIYTSGTTGLPKGVVLTHDNIYSNVMASRRAVPFEGQDTGLSFLPLSHIFERMAGHYLMLEV